MHDIHNSKFSIIGFMKQSLRYGVRRLHLEASPLVMMRLDEFIEGLDGLQMNELVLQRFWIDIVTFGQLVGKLSLLKTTPD